VTPTFSSTWPVRPIPSATPANKEIDDCSLPIDDWKKQGRQTAQPSQQAHNRQSGGLPIVNRQSAILQRGKGVVTAGHCQELGVTAH
jgi:hypothetical protein